MKHGWYLIDTPRVRRVRYTDTYDYTELCYYWCWRVSVMWCPCL